MDLFFCIPIIFGCQTRTSPEGDQTPRICPRCHNATVTRAKYKDWFEFCFVPLFPISSKHVWRCSICRWTIPIKQGPEPPMVRDSVPEGYYPPSSHWQQSYN